MGAVSAFHFMLLINASSAPAYPSQRICGLLTLPVVQKCVTACAIENLRCGLLILRICMRVVHMSNLLLCFICYFVLGPRAITIALNFYTSAPTTLSAFDPYVHQIAKFCAFNFVSTSVGTLSKSLLFFFVTSVLSFSLEHCSSYVENAHKSSTCVHPQLGNLVLVATTAVVAVIGGGWTLASPFLF
ncbi:hypothetical protein TRVL_00831 [Trypanosoma vivax]|nr:hypothetical protein TRVL_00831 [Trypanosoma vivax]